ncbi:NIMA interactive protein [Beauveria brongniartii RCEF 3172]|uniref:NIMA interactive protein n=1 Tax=Beauveria brongniartii RCEF 3172 TaxID=1081107 RepID=A0A167J588_9HYPO|nr:NIMA interactive protein [Beauveria brongniartii RCEF 3172]
MGPKRDADHRESLSATMRSLRAENIKHLNDISKLEERAAEAQRKLEIATSAENAAKTQLKSAESTMRGLKEQLARTKALVAQTRTSCATEVRRRDRQIDTLKKQLGEAGRARGARTNPAITTITITGNVDEEPPSPTKTGGMLTDEYSLRGESTVSLAKLSQNLSEENEAVLALMSQAMDQLREMSGWEEGKGNTQRNQQQNLEDMSAELESIMEHMRNILNNPSFVSIEEVVVREEEINRLKEGWVKMETRWKDAMLLIDGWRKRMAAGGSPIREDELKHGFRLGSVRLTAGITSDMGDSTLEPLEEALEEEEKEEYGEENIYDHSGEEFEDVDDENAAYDGEEKEHRGEMANDELVEKGTPHDEARQDSEHSQEEPEETPEEMTEKSSKIPAQQIEAEAHAINNASPESTSLPEPPQLSPLRKSSSAGNRGSQQAQPTASARRKQPETSTSSSLPASTQRHGSASGALHVQKRNLEQPGRRPTRVASKVPEATSNRRLPTRVTSLEEALLYPPRQAVEPKLEEPVDEQLATKTEKTTQSRQDSKTDAQPETKLRKATAPASQRSISGLTPRKPFPRPAEPISQQSPLTMSNIAAKLAASEADADRVRAKVLAARSRPITLKPFDRLKDSHGVAHEDGPSSGAESQTHARAAASETRTENVENVDPAKVDLEHPVREQDDGHLKVQKRKRDIRISSKRTSRRRSTLSPMELETLIAGAEQ